MSKDQLELIQISWFDERFYRIDLGGGDFDYYPSATTKLNIVNKPFLAQWRGTVGNDQADKVMNDSANRGTRLHDAWYTLNTGGLVIFNDWRNPTYPVGQIESFRQEHEGNISIITSQEEMYQIVKLKNWIDVVKPKFVESEVMVYSQKYRDAGTVDNIVEIEEGEYLVDGAKPVKLGGTYIMDLKTGKSIDDNGWMQMACYANCVNEMELATDLAGTIILHTSSTNRKGIEGLATKVHTIEETRQDFEDFRHASSLWERKNANASPRIFEFPSLLKLEETK